MYIGYTCCAIFDHLMQIFCTGKWMSIDLLSHYTFQKHTSRRFGQKYAPSRLKKENLRIKSDDTFLHKP